MTPQEKAGELVIKYIPNYKNVLGFSNKEFFNAKNCALIAVGEILKVACDESDYDKSVTKLYWQEVKQEIEKL